MQKNKWCYKVGFYLLSMLFFLIIVMILGTDIPEYIDTEGNFIGWNVFLTKGVVIPMICIVLIIISFIFCIILYKSNKGTRLGPITKTKYENISSDVMSFVASYFFPLVSFNINSTFQHIIVLAFLFILIGFIYIRADIYYYNPTLLLLGFRVYRVEGITGKDNSFKQTIIIRGKLNDGDKIKYIPIDNKTSFAFRIK